MVGGNGDRSDDDVAAEEGEVDGGEKTSGWLM